MKKLLLCVVLCLSAILPNISYSAKKVAKAIISRGDVKFKNVGSKKYSKLKKGSWVGEKAVVKTGKRSIVKLLFIDKSQMTLGPNGKLVISKFPKRKAGLISLIKGQMNNKIIKNYLDKDGKKDKLYIRTKTAAMGVRGTEFKILYNPKNRRTSVVTFSGEVRMVQREKNKRLPYRSFKTYLNSEKAVSIKRGQFAGSTKAGRVNIPVKISPAQLNSMKANSDFLKSSDSRKKKTFQSPIPKGVSAKDFAGSNDEAVGQSLSINFGGTIAREVLRQVDKKIKEESASEGDGFMPPPEGFKNEQTGEFAPAAGGYLDVNTGLYISPPPGSQFDANTGTYTPPGELGGFDPNSGNYTPPEGFRLDSKGEFVARAGSVESDFGVIRPPPTFIDESQSGDLALTFDVTRLPDDYVRPIPEDDWDFDYGDDSNDAPNVTNQTPQPTVRFNIIINP